MGIGTKLVGLTMIMMNTITSWASSATFAKYYKKQVPKEKQYAQKVMGAKN